MAKVINKKTCPHCGQSVNEREIVIIEGMITALYSVWCWCIEKELSANIKRAEFKHLFKNENEIMRFADLKYFIPDLIFGEKTGYYSFNIQGISRLFAGKIKIPTRIIKEPITKEIKYFDYRTINDIPKLTAFLTRENEFIVKYWDKHGDTPLTLF